VPTREALLEMLRTFQLPELNHGDLTWHNFILDGERLHLIDGYDGWGLAINDRQNLDAMIQNMEAL
jgi:tRNA A-37 threonylcarbamoyl transferase component Bud32